MAIYLDETLSIEDAMKVIRFEEKLEFTDECIKRVKKSRDFIKQAIDKNIPIYGVTTGLGSRLYEINKNKQTKNIEF